jgi:hypothetical protein
MNSKCHAIALAAAPLPIFAEPETISMGYAMPHMAQNYLLFLLDVHRA